MKRTTVRESKHSIAFSSEVDTGSREENASKTRPWAVPLRVVLTAGIRCRHRFAMPSGQGRGNIALGQVHQAMHRAPCAIGIARPYLVEDGAVIGQALAWRTR